MMTNTELSLGYQQRFNREITEENLSALKRFIHNFELEDYTDFNEMYAALALSLRDVTNEVMFANNPREVFKRRYRNL